MPVCRMYILHPCPTFFQLQCIYGITNHHHINVSILMWHDRHCYQHKSKFDELLYVKIQHLLPRPFRFFFPFKDDIDGFKVRQSGICFCLEIVIEDLYLYILNFLLAWKMSLSDIIGRKFVSSLHIQ